ncbi:hypothetical protein FRC09_015640 [Ceratobasidium sp. 395]|nr:hypothetical protein FRC09_015640 [Ceratobasidium sp. 395]
MASTPNSIELNSCPTLVADTLTNDKSVTEPKSIALFLDTFNNSAVLPALPIITRSIDLTESDAVWLLAAYQATFASFLLISGRVSDVYSPKPVSVVGTVFFGAISLGAGFVNDRIVLIVLRALQGIGASLTIPSALGMLVQIFPEPVEQARAISMFAASAAIGNSTIIGALFVQYASWRWVFWIIAVIALPIAVACIFLIPTTPRRDDTKVSQLDFVGVSTLTAAIILFVYALTTGSVSPWASAGVLVPLFISVALVTAFFVWEAHVDEKNAALPPKLWFYPNFAVLFAVALVPYFWWIQVYLTFVPYWQEVLHWSSIMTGVKFLSLAVTGGIITINGERISRLGRSKLLIIGGLCLELIGTIMLPFSDKPHDEYWPLVFPALLIGTPGTATIFVLTNISFFRNTPPEYAGTVGAVFNAALQLGAAIGTSATTSIQATVDGRTSSGSGFTGRFAALWFLVAYIALEIVGVAVFYRDERSLGDLEAKAAATDPADVKGDTVVAT